MKKIYISPAVEYVEMFAAASMMTTTSMFTSPEEEDDGGRGNDEFQTGEFRGDWSNIWDGM